MNALDALKKEKVETRARIKKLKKGAANEQLRKEALKLECELTTIKRPSIIRWLAKLFT